MAPQSILMIHPSYLGVQLELLMGITFNRGNITFKTWNKFPTTIVKYNTLSAVKTMSCLPSPSDHHFYR